MINWKLYGSGWGLILENVPEIALEGLRKTRKTTVGVPGVPAEARTGHLPNRSQKGTCSSGSSYTLIPTVLVVTAPT